MQPANTGTHRANIYARVSLPEGVAVSELGDNGNWVEAPILREGCRDHLERVREATDRNTLEQQELVEDLRSVGSRLSAFAIVGFLLLLASLVLNGYLIFQLQHILH